LHQGLASQRAPTATLLACLALTALAPRLDAQVVRGAVTEVGDSTPIVDAQLVLRDDNDRVRATAVSGPGGRFELRVDGPATVRLEVSHVAYADWWTASFPLGADDVIEVAVRLGIEAIPLEPITVLAASEADGRLAGFRQRSQDPGGFGGYFLTEEDIGRRPLAPTSSLVASTPGITLGRAGGGGTDRSVILANNCVARIFIDGVSVTQTEGGSIDDLLPADHIAGIEVYPRLMQAPPQYQSARGAACGVVLFWTKEPTASVSAGRSLRTRLIGFGLLGALVTLMLVR